MNLTHATSQGEAGSGPALREIQGILNGRRLVVVSNRAPYARHRREGKVRWVRATGGLVSALDPVLQRCRGLWIAAGTLNADGTAEDSQGPVALPPDDPLYTLQRVWLTEAEVRGFYSGFSNGVLWPLCHLQMDKVRYREAAWRRYREVNEKFAAAVAESARPDDVIWWQDYHLALAPAFLRAQRPDLLQIHFWHVPWPPWDIFRTCPWRADLLEGLLANDLLGFHLQRFCDNFLHCALAALGVRATGDEGEFRHQERTGQVSPFPISIDFEEWERNAQSPSVERHRRRLSHPFEVMGIGVERLDYTKGILERFIALERFYDRYPEHRGRVGFVQVAVPSRAQLADYQDYRAKVEAQINRINQRYQVGDSPPVQFLYRSLPRDELIARYRLADFTIVSSLHDGMNLVAKEFIACQVDQKGILICSEFAGAAEELENALIINPYDSESFAQTLKEAVEMPAEEQAQRMEGLRGHVARYHIFKWCADILGAAPKGAAPPFLRSPEPPPPGTSARPLKTDAEAAKASFATTPTPALLLDYDGTLTPIAPSPQSARLSARAIGLLEGLKGCGVSVGILSGRALSDLKERVPLFGITLSGNHGLEVEGPEGSWHHPEAVQKRPLLARLASSLGKAFNDESGVWVEDKGFSLSLHYRGSPPERTAVIRSRAEAVASDFVGIRLRRGKKVIEFRPDVDWDKGSLLLRLMKEWRPGWVLYAGDDETDEDAFRAVVGGGWEGMALRVGEFSSSTWATHWAKDPEELLGFLDFLLSAKRNGP